MNQLLTVKETAKYLGTSERQVRVFLELGMLQGITIGRGVKVSDQDIDDMLIKYKGLDISSREKCIEARKIIERRKLNG